MRNSLGAVAAITLLLVLVLPVLGYSGHGDDNLPCTTGGYWVINHLDGADAPVLTVGDVAATLVKQPNPDIAHYESGPVDSSTEVTVVPEVGQLQLSHCITVTDPPESPSSSPSAEPIPSDSPEPSGTAPGFATGCEEIFVGGLGSDWTLVLGDSTIYTNGTFTVAPGQYEFKWLYLGESSDMEGGTVIIYPCHTPTLPPTDTEG